MAKNKRSIRLDVIHDVEAGVYVGKNKRGALGLVVEAEKIEGPGGLIDLAFKAADDLLSVSKATRGVRPAERIYLHFQR